MGDRAPSEAFGLLPTIYDDRAELGSLAGECEDWAVDAPHSGHRTGERCGDMHLSLRRAAEHGGWVWPSRPVVFVSDPHADAEGFLRSLVAAGVIRRSVVNTHGFELTTFGRSARIVVGGDCLDKGPSNLDLLDVLNTLIKTGADVHLLAGNHDLRLHLAVVGLSGPRTALTEHLFVRMGRKIVPLLREVRDRYLAHADRKCWLSEKDARARIFPSDKWAKKFPKAAAASMPQATIEKEVAKLAKKSA
ncbi:MAG: metallophosphoesterase, partial [Pseudomonadota bacterium]